METNESVDYRKLKTFGNQMSYLRCVLSVG